MHQLTGDGQAISQPVTQQTHYNNNLIQFSRCSIVTPHELC